MELIKTIYRSVPFEIWAVLLWVFIFFLFICSIAIAEKIFGGFNENISAGNKPN